MTLQATQPTQIQNQCYDEERALYGSKQICIESCRFEGPADGESALKECRDVTIRHSRFDLRYPIWHCDRVLVESSEMTSLCRAPLWYCEDVRLVDCRIDGVKALRECRRASIEDCTVRSTELGWSTTDLEIRRSTVEGEYLFLRAEGIKAEQLSLKGKYSLQYVQNATFTDCTLDTKDAFWHAKGITLINCTLKGEYLAWYAEDITLINCRIIGTQPFCYCKGLRLIDCEMHEADFCFERSEVEATVTTPVISIRRPRAGRVFVPAVGEILEEDSEALGEIFVG